MLTKVQSLDRSTLLKACMLATGFAGIVAEYVMATIASYLIGDVVIQYVLMITVMLFAMAIGSALSKRIQGDLLGAFIAVEIFLSMLCGTSALVAYGVSAVSNLYPIAIYGMGIGIGVLIGMEIPLVTRLNAEHEGGSANISSIMTADYVGCLIGGLFFAFLALPKLGMTWTPLILGLVNLSIAAMLFLNSYTGRRYRRGVEGILAAFVLIILAGFTSPQAVIYGEQKGYQDKIVYREQSKYQRIIMTRWRQHHTLYLNTNLQFSSYDEERYHEPLVHPAIELAKSRSSAALSVVILGGGDGLALREILKHDAVESVTMVDLDPAVVRLGREHPVLTRLNEGSMESSKLTVVNKDARLWLERQDELYDVVIIDLPDPNSVELARLYTRGFYKLVSKHLSRSGVVVTQATSPYFSPKAYFSIWKSMEASGLSVTGYHTHVPTMGEWGWVIGQKLPDINESLLSVSFEGYSLRYLTRDLLGAMLTWSPEDTAILNDVAVNTSLDLELYYYYRRDPRWELY